MDRYRYLTLKISPKGSCDRRIFAVMGDQSHSQDRISDCGGQKYATIIVIIMAMTPSLNAVNLPFSISIRFCWYGRFRKAETIALALGIRLTVDDAISA